MDFTIIRGAIHIKNVNRVQIVLKNRYPRLFSSIFIPPSF